MISELSLSLKDLSDHNPLAAYKAYIVHCTAQIEAAMNSSNGSLG